MRTAYRLYQLVGNHLVSGWIEPGTLPMIRALAEAQDALEVHGGIAEVGVHHGRLFIALHLARREGEKSLAIDIFDDQQLNFDASGQGDRARFERNLRFFAGGNRDVEVIAANSMGLSPGTVNATLGTRVRMFSVDGGHTSGMVSHDLQLAETSLAPGGIIISDDMFNEQWPGVQEGTYNFLRAGSNLVPFAVCFNKTLFASRTHACEYRDALASLGHRRIWHVKYGSMYGEEVLILWRPHIVRRVRMTLARLVRILFRISGSSKT